MQKSKTLCPKNFAFLGFFIGVIFFSWKIQSHLLLNWDVSWCLHTAAKLIAGGDYVKDFLQVDLPLTLYLYSPAIFLAEHYSISLMLASQIYLMYLGILSVAVSYYFLHKNFKNNDLFICLITLCSALILFVLPAENYGQREHLFLMFTLPYFFMLTLRWQGLWIHPLIAVLLGCSAGIGFLIKPYFFMTFLLLELYYLFYSKNKFSWYRPEVITIIFLTLLYGNFINIFQPNIIHINIPFIQKYFYASFALTESWTQILTRGAIFYALAAFLFFFIIDKNHFPYKELTHILFIATVGSLFSYLVQRTSWPYHFLPLVALTSLLWLVLCFQFFQKNTFNNHKQWIFVTVFICLISFYPIKFFLKEYHAGIFYRERTALLIQYLRQHANNQSVFFISTLLQDGLPAVDYANANLVGRSVFLPMFPAILKKIATEANPEKLASLKQDESFFMKMIIDDLNEKKPRFVFIDKRQQKMYLDKNFEYLPYFTKDVEFIKAWKPYHYVGEIIEPEFTHINYDLLFYTYPSFNEEKFSSLSEQNKQFKKVFLIGEGEKRSAYIPVYRAFSDKIDWVSVNILLSPDEQQFMDKHSPGLIDKNQDALVRQNIIQKIVYTAFPFYHLDVYERN